MRRPRAGVPRSARSVARTGRGRKRASVPMRAECGSAAGRQASRYGLDAERSPLEGDRAVGARDLDRRGRGVREEVLAADPAGALDRDDTAAGPEHVSDAGVGGRPAHERRRERGRREAERSPVGAVPRRLRTVDARVPLADRSPRGDAGLQDEPGLHAEGRGVPQHDVGETTRAQRADLGVDAVDARRLGRHLREVAQDALVVVGRLELVAAADRRREGMRTDVGARAPALHHVRELERAANGLADASHALRVRVHDRDRAELVQRSLGGHRDRADAAMGRGDVLGETGVRRVHEHDHVGVLRRRGRAERQRRRRRAADHVPLSHDAEQVRHVTPAGSLDVVRVHRAAARRRDGVLELARLVQPVGVEADGDVVRLGDRERRVDDRGICPPVLVHLEADRTGLDHRVEPAGHVGAGTRLQADVHGESLERLERAVHAARRLLEPCGDERGHAGAERDRYETRRQQMDVRVDHAGGGDEAVRDDRPRVRPDRQVDTIHDVGVPGAADADDAAVLDPDVGLHDADPGIDDDHTRDHGVELAVARRAVVLRHPRAPVLREPPERLVGGIGEIRLDPDPQVGVAETHAVARRRAVAERVLLARDAFRHRPSCPRTQRA
jgi:hypothetical protein